MFSQKSLRAKYALELASASTMLILIFSALLYHYVRITIFEGPAQILASKANELNYSNLDDYEMALTKNLTSLYIIYSNAPYVGLLGTVSGIMITFYDMGMSGGIDTKSIMIGLSLALKATGLGLLVAIPTLMIYNGFNRKVDILVTKFKVLNAIK